MVRNDDVHSGRPQVHGSHDADAVAGDRPRVEGAASELSRRRPWRLRPQGRDRIAGAQVCVFVIIVYEISR